MAPRFYDRDEAGRAARAGSRWSGTRCPRSGRRCSPAGWSRDYVTRLYVPAARSAGAVTDGSAKELAGFKARVRAAWPGVRVDHVESAGVSDTPQVGDEVQVRAFVSLGTLVPDEVDVQLVYGRVSPSDLLTDTVGASLVHAEAYEGGRHRYEGTVRLRRTGPFGYTVRVLPRQPLLATPAELGLVTNASA